MKSLVIAAVAVAALGASAPAQDVDLTGVTRLDLGGRFDVEVTVGGPAEMRMEGDAEEIDKIKVRVRDGELELDGKSRRFLIFGGGKIDVDVFISLPTLDAVDVSRGVYAEVGGVAAETFDIDASTGADLEISGTCGELTVDASTGANIDGDALECRRVEAEASTGAGANLRATEAVDASASTGGDIRVAGGAEEVSKSTSTGGDVSVY